MAEVAFDMVRDELARSEYAHDSDEGRNVVAALAYMLMAIPPPNEATPPGMPDMGQLLKQFAAMSWPYDDAEFKEDCDVLQSLVRAAALLVAEIGQMLTREGWGTELAP